MKTIRLLMPIRVGHQVHPNNAVFDAEDSVADELLNSDPPCAEETAAVERYPVGQPLTRVDDFPVTGQEKFPLAEGEETHATPAMFSNHADRLVQKRINAAEPPPEVTSKEPAPAKVEVTEEQAKEGEARPDAHPDVVKAPEVKPVTPVVAPVAPVKPSVVTPAAPTPKDKA
jgi:hypothetical protein